jgi:hypothetical protein
MKSSYFKDNSGEQNLVEDLSIESIKINGRDMIYIPRQLLDEDKLFGEDNSAKFSKGYEFLVTSPYLLTRRDKPQVTMMLFKTSKTT